MPRLWTRCSVIESPRAKIQKFEATGMASIMKDDYVSLHVLEARISQCATVPSCR